MGDDDPRVGARTAAKRRAISSVIPLIHGDGLPADASFTKCAIHKDRRGEMQSRFVFHPSAPSIDFPGQNR